MEEKEVKTRVRRRSSGEGSISQRKDGYWVGQVTIGFDTRTCKQLRKSIVRKTRTEVVDEIRKLLNKKATHTLVKTDRNTTLGQWLDKWLTTYKKVSLKPTTYSNYQADIDWIKPIIGDNKLQKVATSTVQDFINTMVYEKNLSPRTVNDCINLLSNALNYAVKLKLIESNPCDFVQKPKAVRKEMKIWTPEQMYQFKNICAGYYLEAAMQLLMYGLRRGEILGLTIENVNFRKSYITIKNTLVKTTDGVVLQETPKTSASRRIVPIASDTMRLLKEVIGGREEGLVFQTNEGNYIHPRSFQRSFDMLIKRAKLPKIRLHDMRHSTVSLLLSSGCDVKTVSQLVGHANTKVTLDIYTHSTFDKQREAVTVIGSMIFDKK